MNANPAFGIEWARRMRMLGYRRLDEDPAYDSLGVAGVLAIAREMRPRHRSVFVVWHAAAPPLALPARYSNADYVVYEAVGIPH